MDSTACVVEVVEGRVERAAVVGRVVRKDADRDARGNLGRAPATDAASARTTSPTPAPRPASERASAAAASRVGAMHGGARRVMTGVHSGRRAGVGAPGVGAPQRDIGRDGAQRAQGDGARTEHHGDLAAHVDHGGLDARVARTGVEHEVDPIAELLHDVRGGRRREPLVAVRARGGDGRAESPRGARERRGAPGRGPRWSSRPRPPRPARRARARPRASTARARTRARASPRTRAMRRTGAGRLRFVLDVGDQRVVHGPPLRGEDRARGPARRAPGRRGRTRSPWGTRPDRRPRGPGPPRPGPRQRARADRSAAPGAYAGR